MFLEPLSVESRLFTRDNSSRVSPTHRRGCPALHPPDADSVTATDVSASPPEIPARLQLDPDGYPTHALYHLHKRMLDIVSSPEVDQTRANPGTPTASPPFTSPGVQGLPNPNNLFELPYGSDGSDQTLDDLHGMLFSPDYVLPPSPPCGASPSNTPPQFELHIKGRDREEHANHVARILASYDVLDIEAQTLEFEVESKRERRACPSSVTDGIEPGSSRKSLFEEMRAVGVRTPCMVWDVEGWRDEGWTQVQGIAI